MMETSDTRKTQAKPMLVIKKGNIYNTSNVPILQTFLKRPNPNVSVEDNPSAKRPCLVLEKSLKHELDIEVDSKSTEDKTETQVQNENKPKNSSRKSTTILGRQAGGVCMGHDEPLREHQAEGLLRPGDTFASIDDFNKYITENAKKWFFYYVRSETRLNKPHGTCVYRCKYFRKHQRCQSTGKRAQKNKSICLNCPASVHLKRTANSDEIKVTLVCHHHTHQLSKEVFKKQPHGYRLPQEIKDEIKDLALLNVHPGLIRKYVKSIVPDLNIGKTVINTVLKLRREGITKDILSAERLAQMLEKIRYIKANFDISLTGSKRKSTPKYLDTSRPISNSTKKAVRKRKKGKKIIEEIIDLENDSESKANPPEVVVLIEEVGDSDTSTIKIENYTELEELSTSEEDEEQFDRNEYEKQIGLINPTTGNFDDSEPVVAESVGSDQHLLLINSETGLLDVKVPKDEPTDDDQSSNDVEQIVNLRKYKIGNISIECAETVDESGNATVTLNEIKARGGLTKSTVLNQLSKVEKSINEPINYSMKALRKKGGRQRRLDEDPVEEAKMRCQIRHDTLPEQQAEGLVQVGSTFSSIEELLSYVASKAPKWYFYYHVFDSRNTKGSPKYDSRKSILYNLNCRFNKGFYKSKSKGLRKVKRKSILCPAALNVKCLPGEDKFTVMYACHHHSHELSPELFGQEAHGHRLPQELKEEIRVLAWFKLDSGLIKLYLEDLTGLKMGKTVKNIVAMMKKKGLKVDVPPEKMTEVLQKIKDIKQKFQIPKRGPASRKLKIGEAKEDDRSDSDKEEVENKSRVETRLHNIQYDQELIQSVRELEENTGCEIELNSWGGADVINNGVNLKEGLETKYDEPQDEPTECQIKIDQEVYNMDDTVQYIIPSDQEGSNNIFGVEFAGVGDRIVYIQDTEETVPEVDAGLEYDNTVIHEEIHEDGTNVVTLVDYCEDVYDNNANSNEDALDDEIEQIIDECPSEQITEEYQNEMITEEEQIQQITEEEQSQQMTEEEQITEEEQSQQFTEEEQNQQITEEEQSQQIIEEEQSELITEQDHQIVYIDQNNCDSPGICTQLAHQCSVSENEYQSMFYDDKEIYYRDVGVQADLEIIQLEGEYEKISKLESSVVHDNTEETIYSYNSRSTPKYILEEAIINRFNIEFYINYCSIGTCLENLAGCMGTSVLTLLKQLYKGEAVFKITSGRSGNQNRKTVNVAYHPLTIAFPYEKFKYINHLQEYRTICSKYSDVTMQLEDTVRSVSKALEAKTLELEEFISRNHDQGQLIASYEELQKNNTHLQESLQKTETELAEMKQQNDTLTKKITHLEQLNISARIKDAEILKQLLTSPPKEDKEILEHKIQELAEEKAEEINEKLYERIKDLERSLKRVYAENKNYKTKTRKLATLYYTENQELLEKINSLEAQIQQYKEEADDNFAENQNSLKLLTFAETKCRKLEKKLKELETPQSSDKKRVVGKINSVEEAQLKTSGSRTTRSRQKK